MKKRFLLAASLIALVSSCEQADQSKPNNGEQKKQNGGCCETQKVKEALPSQPAAASAQAAAQPASQPSAPQTASQSAQTVATPEVKVEKAK